MRVPPFFCLLILLLSVSSAALAQKKRPPASRPAPLDRQAVSRADSLVLQARALATQQKEAEALDKCRLALSANPTQYEALWRASVLSSRIGGRYTDETRKNNYYENARAYAARALEVHPSFVEANYAMALAVASLGSLAPLQGRLQARLEEKPYLDAALKADPNAADVWQLLGRWQFKVANYTLLEKLASRLLLGAAPPETNNRQALESMGRAIAANPRRIEFYYDLARMHQLLGQRRQAIQVLIRAQDVELVTTEDLAVRRQCAELLEQLERRQRLDAPEFRAR